MFALKKKYFTPQHSVYIEGNPIILNAGGIAVLFHFCCTKLDDNNNEKFGVQGSQYINNWFISPLRSMTKVKKLKVLKDHSAHR